MNVQSARFVTAGQNQAGGRRPGKKPGKRAVPQLKKVSLPVELSPVELTGHVGGRPARVWSLQGPGAYRAMAAERDRTAPVTTRVIEG